MSTDMTLRLVILAVIALFIILGIAMDQDSYRGRPPKTQPAPEPGQ